jgi:hypothetical protein
MNRLCVPLASIVVTLGSAQAAHAADPGECFPTCPAVPDEPAPPLDLCRHAIVREGVRLDVKMRPIREVIHIVQNPTGFVIKTVGEQTGVHVPPWVPYVVDPRGAIRAKAVEVIRNEVKKSMGLANDCRAQDYSAVT